MSDFMPEALRPMDAKRFIGATDRKWREIKRTLERTAAGSYRVSDLRAIIGRGVSEEGREMGGVEKNAEREDLGVRGQSAGSRRRSRRQAVHPLDRPGNDGRVRGRDAA